MPPVDRASHASFNCDRRQFIQMFLAGTMGFWSRELLVSHPALAQPVAEAEISSSELYHLFVGETLAQIGGQLSITLKSGQTELLSIPANCREGMRLTLKQAALPGGRVTIVLHTLYDPWIDFDAVIDTALASTPLMAGTRDRCRIAYRHIKAGESVIDVHAQDVLDIVISGSPELASHPQGQVIRDRYHLASQHARLLALQRCISDTIAASRWSQVQKLRLQGIYQCVWANESLPSPQDFEALTTLDALVQYANLPLALKQRYAIASAQTRAFTVDAAILALIQHSDAGSEAQQHYRIVYHQIRLGQPVTEPSTLMDLDAIVDSSMLAPVCKMIYRLARHRFFQQDEATVAAALQQNCDRESQATQLAPNLISTLSQVLALTNELASSETAIAPLTETEAANTTLATWGQRAVSHGGLGMLGGLAIATGGTALVGAAALVSASLVMGMDEPALKKLGLIPTAEMLSTGIAVGTAWAALRTLGATPRLSSIIASSTVMATLGNIGATTAGAALVTFGVGLGAWQWMAGQETVSAMIRGVEPLLYTITEPSAHPLIAIFNQHFHNYRQEFPEVHMTPNIPIDQLAHTLSHDTALDRDEKVLVVVDTNELSSTSGGIVFSDRGVWWNQLSSPQFLQYSDPDYHHRIKQLPKIISLQEEHQIHHFALQWLCSMIATKIILI